MRLTCFFIRFLLCLMVMGLAVSCGRSKVLEEDRMKKVMWDLIRVDEFAVNYLQRDTTVDVKAKTKDLYAQVFSMHQTTQEQFLESLKHYKARPSSMQRLMDSLNTYANRMREMQFMQNVDTAAAPLEPQ